MPIVLQVLIRAVIGLGVAILAFLDVIPENTLPPTGIPEIMITSTSTPRVATSTPQAPSSPVTKTPPKKTPPPPKTSTSTTLTPTFPSLPQINLPSFSFGATTTPVQPTTTPSSWSEVDSRSRDAIVNIVCFNLTRNLITVTTGSGVIIDPRGVILTNAHVAQYFLFTKNNEAGLTDYSCTIRKGNVATAAYTAELLYIPRSWITRNSDVYRSQHARGTGERDYAFLLITGHTNPTLSLPSTFSYVAPNTLEKAVDVGSDVLLAGYPANSLTTFSLESALGLTTEVRMIEDVYTFGGQTLDIIATNETKLAHQGSSGGGVLDKNAKVVGLMVSTGTSRSGSVNINALTLSYISRHLDEETGRTLQGLLSGNLKEKVTIFKETEASLRTLFSR
jgi:S1-C subfamily serine protease